jgi:hypothetical protein
MTMDGLSSGDDGDAGLVTEVDVSRPSALRAAPADAAPPRVLASHGPEGHGIVGDGFGGQGFEGHGFEGHGFEDNGSEDTVNEDGDAGGKHLDSSIVEELTNRLPTSELVKIIKNALECGRRNVPFTESALLRAMTFGSGMMPSRQPNTRAIR